MIALLKLLNAFLICAYIRGLFLMAGVRSNHFSHLYTLYYFQMPKNESIFTITIFASFFTIVKQKVSENVHSASFCEFKTSHCERSLITAISCADVVTKSFTEILYDFFCNSNSLFFQYVSLTLAAEIKCKEVIKRYQVFTWLQTKLQPSTFTAQNISNSFFQSYQVFLPHATRHTKRIMSSVPQTVHNILYFFRIVEEDNFTKSLHCEIVKEVLRLL